MCSSVCWDTRRSFCEAPEQQEEHARKFPLKHSDPLPPDEMDCEPDLMLCVNHKTATRDLGGIFKGFGPAFWTSLHDQVDIATNEKLFLTAKDIVNADPERFHAAAVRAKKSTMRIWSKFVQHKLKGQLGID